MSNDTNGAMAVSQTADTIVVTAEHIRAVELHRRIMAEAEIAGSAIIAMAAGLKEMRDTRLYIELGFETFESYVELAAGLKRRQAYNYIAVYEKLPAQVLQSTAHIGITKLELLTQVPALERDEFIEENDLDGLSVREMREKIKALEDQVEQLSLVTEPAPEEDAEAAHAAMRETIEALQAEVEQFKLKASYLGETEREMIREAAREEAERAAADKIKAAQEAAAKAEQDAERKAKEKAEAAAAEKIEAAKQVAIKEAEAHFSQSLSIIEEEKELAVRKAADLENQLKVAGNDDTLRFTILFDELQTTFNRLHGVVLKVRAEGNEADAGKLSAALVQALDMLKAKVEG